MPISSLEHAVAALARQAPVEALERLLEAWRAARSPELAARIEALSARFSVDGLQDSKAWIARARKGRTEDRSTLIAELVRSELAAQTTLHFGPDGSRTVSGPVEDLASRLDEVAKWADDPRAAQLGLRVLSWPGDGVSWRKGFLRAFRCIDASADPTAIAGLEARLKVEERKEQCRPSRCETTSSRARRTASRRCASDFPAACLSCLPVPSRCSQPSTRRSLRFRRR